MYPDFNVVTEDIVQLVSNLFIIDLQIGRYLELIILTCSLFQSKEGYRSNKFVYFITL